MASAAGVHKAKEADPLTDDTDSRHVIHFRFFPPYSRLRATMHRMHTESGRDNATFAFARLNLFSIRGLDKTHRQGFCDFGDSDNIQRVAFDIFLPQETDGIFWAGQLSKGLTGRRTGICEMLPRIPASNAKCPFESERRGSLQAPAAMRAIKESVRRNFWQDGDGDGDVYVDRVCIARATRDGSRRSHDRGARARPPFVGIYY